MNSQHVFFWPVIIGILSTTGLVAGLVADGWGDALAWLTLSVPVLASLVFSFGSTPRDADMTGDSARTE